MLITKIAKLFTKPNPDLAKDIKYAGFTPRTYHLLRKAGIAVVGDLTRLSWRDIAAMRSSVRATCVEVEKVLGKMGLGLKKGDK